MYKNLVSFPCKPLNVLICMYAVSSSGGFCLEMDRSNNTKMLQFRVRRVMLGYFLICGLISGLAFYRFSTGTFLAYIRCKPEAFVPTGWVFASFVASVLLYRLFGCISSAVIYLICLCKAFLFSYTHCWVIYSFSGSGWLLRWIFLFSQITTLPVLYFYWLHLLSGRKPPDFCVFIMLFLIDYLDQAFIAPLGRALLLFQKG